MNLKKLNLYEPLLLLFWVLLVSYFFANVEIQIEGGKGWASGLPTWRIEKHPLLDLFWGGRPMTGYHAWVFSFMFLIFHLSIFTTGKWNLKLESRILGSLMLFWIAEDFIWFILNPSFGLNKFSPEFIPWHKKWLFSMPLDYITFTIAGIILLVFSYWQKKSQSD